MPKDVLLGEGYTGEALLQAFPNQYRDSSQEVTEFGGISTFQSPGVTAGRPSYADPDLPRPMETKYIPGVGQVVVPVEHHMAGRRKKLFQEVQGEIDHWKDVITRIASEATRFALHGVRHGSIRTVGDAERYIRAHVTRVASRFTKRVHEISEAVAHETIKTVRPVLEQALSKRKITRLEVAAAKKGAQEDEGGVGNWQSLTFSGVSGDQQEVSTVESDEAGYGDGLGISKEERKRAEEYYWALKNGGLELASKILDILDQWREVKSMKEEAGQRILAEVSKAMPPVVPGWGIVGPIAYLRELMGLLTGRFSPVVKETAEIFRKPEEALKDVAALYGWMMDSWRMNVFPNMGKIRSALGISSYVDSFAVRIIERAGRSKPPFQLSAEEWVTHAFSAVSSRMAEEAQELSRASVEAPRRQRMRETILRSIGKEKLAAELKISVKDVEESLKQIGMGLEPLTVTVIVIFSIVTTAATAAAVYYRGQAKKMAEVGKEGISAVENAAREEVAKLRELMKKQTDAISAEADPEKRKVIAENAKSEVDRAAVSAASKISEVASKAREEVDKTRPAGLDLSSVLVPVGIAAAVVFLVPSILGSITGG